MPGTLLRSRSWAPLRVSVAPECRCALLQEDRRLDRSWYDMEEGSYAHDESSNPFMMDDTTVTAREVP